MASNNPRHRRPPPQCGHSFEPNLYDKRYDDMLLIVHGTAFPVNMDILHQRVPFFRDLLRSEKINHYPTCKSGKKMVEVNLKVSAEIFDRYLRYAYSARLPEVAYLTADLLAIAEKFEDHFLSAICKIYLRCGIKPEEVVEYLKKINSNNNRNGKLSLKEICIKTLFVQCNSMLQFPSCGSIVMNMKRWFECAKKPSLSSE